MDNTRMRQRKTFRAVCSSIKLKRAAPKMQTIRWAFTLLHLFGNSDGFQPELLSQMLPGRRPDWNSAEQYRTKAGGSNQPAPVPGAGNSGLRQIPLFIRARYARTSLPPSSFFAVRENHQFYVSGHVASAGILHTRRHFTSV
jgi:hypothetical protein